MKRVWTRREAVRMVAGVCAVPMFVPARLFGAESPSNVMRIGVIGTGRMGHGDMNNTMSRGMDGERRARVVAVCDVDSKRVEHARQAVLKFYEKRDPDYARQVDVYGDFRQMLARPDIDGVVISTPEHWHAVIAIAAANARKDMYVQKPVTYSVTEGQTLIKAVRRNKVILQTGTQQRSDQRFRRACELVRNGRIGKLTEIHAQLPPDSGTADGTPSQVPGNLDYDLWLGPTAEAAYSENRVHPQGDFGRPGWLQIEKYCRGMITGWGTHMFDIAQWGHGSDVDSGPVEIEATGEFPDRGLFDVHTQFTARGRYADGVVLTAATDKTAGVKFTGSDGWIFVTRGKWDASNKEILREEIGADGVQLYRSADHYANFLDCMRSRKDPICPVEVGHRSNSCSVITHIAMKLGRKLKWDPSAERFVDDEQANAMLGYEYRAPWKLEV